MKEVDRIAIEDLPEELEAQYREIIKKVMEFHSESLKDTIPKTFPTYKEGMKSSVLKILSVVSCLGTVIEVARREFDYSYPEVATIFLSSIQTYVMGMFELCEKKEDVKLINREFQSLIQRCGFVLGKMATGKIEELKKGV